MQLLKGLLYRLTNDYILLSHTNVTVLTLKTSKINVILTMVNLKLGPASIFLASFRRFKDNLGQKMFVFCQFIPKSLLGYQKQQNIPF